MKQVITIYTIEQAQLYKYVCLLLSKLYLQKYRMLVLMQDKTKAQELDNLLWTFSQQSFIPHALVDDDFQGQHPIVITWINNLATNFDTLVIVENFIALDFNEFDRVMLFCTHNSQVNEAQKLVKQFNKEI